IDQQYDILNNELTPLLRDQGIFFLRREEWTDEQSAWIRQYFVDELSPILDPIGLDPAHPFPRLLNKILNFIVSLEGEDAFGRPLGMAVVQAPRSLPRVIQLPPQVSIHPYDFVFLSSIIHRHVTELFQGMKVTACHQFRVTRDSDLFLNEEEMSDLRESITSELSSRRFSDAVRLEIADGCPDHLVEFLREQFDLEPTDVYRCSGPVNLARLSQIPSLVNRQDLKFESFKPQIPSVLSEADGDIFRVIRERDVLLHHPFQSFSPVVDFLKQAARDPDVVSIRQTLYRTGEDSTVVPVLIDAAQREKEVLVVIELRARFDEAENIELANELNEAGVQVVYGMVGFKTHAKIALVIRREGKHLRRYAHLGTGNYHPQTTRLYTDFGLLTCDPMITADVQSVFRQLTSMGHPGTLTKVLQSPFVIGRTFLELIEQEISNVQDGGEGRIIAKCNALEQPDMIRAFYRASQAGVKVDLIIRGVCCLRPGITGVSENITVRSIVGRFLEHSRVFYFHNNGKPKVYLASADLMERNLSQRVETSFPIEDPSLHARVIRDGLETYLQDNYKAWSMAADGTYHLETPGDESPLSAQQRLLEQHQ
ncbi:MAG: polyphosphate kinase 1, partial [Gammaproteobacteria bacterium]|nr:polyphosphate kinase 1 [Gammaproteobacteria bacterium]